MRIAYITAQTPFGRAETFVLNEMLALQEEGLELIIIPRNPPKEVFHKEASGLIKTTLWLPLVNIRILLYFIKSLSTNIKTWKILYCIIRESRSSAIVVKNLAILPKAIYIATILKEKSIDHIHAHWGGTTSTMAWIISEMIGVPWSVTFHRWDIKENNMLFIKAKKASFFRCISENGRKEILAIVGEEFENKIKVLHLGVSIPNKINHNQMLGKNNFVFSCPANIIPVKGHKYLVEACYLIKKSGFDNFKCLIIGDGYLEGDIKNQVKQFGLENKILFLGRLQHQEILRMYENFEIDVVVLPSIVTEDGEKEGIPVSLMEAMSYQIPVISTNTGSIPELIGNDSGILIPPESSTEIANSIIQLAENYNLRMRIAEAGFKRIEESFNSQKINSILIKMFQENN